MMKLSNIVSKKIMPLFMRTDVFNSSLCEGIDNITKDIDATINQKVKFWDNFDNMTEEQLDEVAEELKVHWYRYDAEIEQKREIVKSSKYIKRKLGTPYAIEQVLSIYFRDAHLIEWWEYGGSRKHFKIQTYNSSTINKDAEQFMKVLDKIKRKSAILDYIEVLEYSTNDLLYIITSGNSSVLTSNAIGGKLQ